MNRSDALVHNPMKHAGPDAHAEVIDRLARMITHRWGLVIDGRRRAMLHYRLSKRARELGLKSVYEYAEYATTDPCAAKEAEHLIDVITTQTTSFFREHDHFDFLMGTVLPAYVVAAAGTARPIKIWCAACSTGEEAYTLAMACAEFDRRTQRVAYAITATDISSAALSKAWAGVYPRAELANVPAPLQERYFLQSRDRPSDIVRVCSSLRRHVQFKFVNLASHHYDVDHDFDVIMLRNCLIYFDRKEQVQVVRRTAQHLRQSGYFFTGHTEHFSEIESGMRILRPSVYRKEAR